MSYRTYVALGSSFAAGPGIGPVIDRAAGRSGRNYPHLTAQALGARLTDVTVSGATTATILRDSQRLLGRSFLPQVHAITPDTDLVTITAGGNDLGYIGTILSTAVRNRVADSTLARPLARRLWPARPLAQPSTEQIRAATQDLLDIVTDVQHRAPDARVVLVDYLPVFDESPPPYSSSYLHPDQVAHLRQVGRVLSGAIASAAHQSGADLLSADNYPPGHGVGSTDAWVSALSLRRLPGSFHPTRSGMQAVSTALLDLLRRR